MGQQLHSTRKRSKLSRLSTNRTPATPTHSTIGNWVSTIRVVGGVRGSSGPTIKQTRERLVDSRNIENIRKTTGVSDKTSSDVANALSYIPAKNSRALTRTLTEIAKTRKRREQIMNMHNAVSKMIPVVSSKEVVDTMMVLQRLTLTFGKGGK